ncbi:hypothetical protein ScPMuIL_017937 [Solemya velum]
MAASSYQYDLCIVGAGLFGSAAARHASTLHPEWKICIIGPEEPKERSIVHDRDIFGAHYDEGRIARCVDRSPVYTKFSQESIKRFAELEQASGIEFFTEVGNLLVGSRGTDFIKEISSTIERDNIQCDQLSGNAMKKKFPFLNLPEEDIVFFEETNAGYISPRKMIDAQLSIASRNGCDIIRDIVKTVNRIVITTGHVVELVTDRRTTYMARRVLLATGAFTTLRQLLGPNMQPDVRLMPISVAKVEISAEDAGRIRSMPTVIYFGKGNKGWWDDIPSDGRGRSGFYMLPPIRYPDGKYYLKLGNFPEFQGVDDIQTAADLKAWYCLKDETVLSRALGRLIQTLIPGVKMKSFKPDRCVIVETPTLRPYLDMLHSQLGLVTGGNGWAAKSSDEIGRLAVGMIMGGIEDEELTADMFTTRYKMRSQSKL